MSRSLFQAITACRFKQVRLIIETGLDLSTVKNKQGENALVVALRIDEAEKRERVFRYLVRKGARCDNKDKCGRTVMAWTCILNRPVEMEIVMNETVGAVDFSERDKKGYTVLHYAVFSSNPDIVRYLVRFMKRYDLSADVVDKHCLTPYVHAKRLAYNEIATILVREGGASTRRGDVRGQKSVEDWEKIGKIERENQARMATQRKITEIKIHGRLPKIPYIQKTINEGNFTWSRNNTTRQNDKVYTNIPKTPNYGLLFRSIGDNMTGNAHLTSTSSASIEEVMTAFTDSHTRSYRIPVHITAYSSLSEEQIRQKREHEAMLTMKATKNRKNKKLTSTVSFSTPQTKSKLPGLSTSDEVVTSSEQDVADESNVKNPDVTDLKSKPAMSFEKNNLQVLPDILVSNK